jgi:hypothetical protein
MQQRLGDSKSYRRQQSLEFLSYRRGARWISQFLEVYIGCRLGVMVGVVTYNYELEVVQNRDSRTGWSPCNLEPR